MPAESYFSCVTDCVSYAFSADSLSEIRQEHPHLLINLLCSMLPATPAVVAVWLAAQLAGKTPVLLNWTVGEANLRHCIRITGVSHILSATPLQQRLERQGMALASLPVQWLALDKLAASLTIGEKLVGALRARLPRSCKNCAVPDVAAVLFTSGSESMYLIYQKLQR